MAVDSGDSVAQMQENNPGMKPKQRNNCPGVRVVGGRIYDSHNGKTCHQCRQKTMDVMSVCKNLVNGKPCVIQFCHKCLLNRYGEKAEDVATLEDWKCPRCRGICNCSMCMKKRGFQPTGILVHTAKATGFTSVSEMLQVKGPDNIERETVAKNKDALAEKTAALDKGAEVVSPTKKGKENIFNGNINSKAQPLSLPNSPEKEPRKMKREERNEIQCNGGTDNVSSKVLESSPKKKKFKKMKKEDSLKTKNPNEDDCQKNEMLAVCNKKKSKKMEKMEKKVPSKMPCDLDVKNETLIPVIPLPPGNGLTAVAGIDLPPEDVGDALQFLEFSAAFGKALDLKRGQAEAVLRDLVQGRTTRRGKTNVTAQFLIHLLSILEEDDGTSSTSTLTDEKGSWFNYLKEIVSESSIIAKSMGLDSLNDATDGIESLDASIKLKLLNFVCDEVLNTARIRNWIDDENTKCAEKAKEAKEKISAAKEEEKRLKKEMQDKIAEKIISMNGAPISVSEHDAIVSQVKREASEAHAAVLESKGLLLKCNQIADAIRTEPVFSDTNGQVFWRLKCFSDKSEILLQELGSEDDNSNEKWLTFDEAHKETVEKRIDSLRPKKLRAPVMLPFPNNEEDK